MAEKKASIFVIVGAEGSGRTEILKNAVPQLAKDDSFPCVYAYQTITFDAVGHPQVQPPDKEINNDEFELHTRFNKFQLFWKDDFGRYAILEKYPEFGTFENVLEKGTNVFVKLPIKLLPDLQKKYPKYYVKAVVIHAPKQLLKQRLKDPKKGLRNTEEIERDVELSCTEVQNLDWKYVINIENNASIEEGVRRFIKAIKEPTKEEEVEKYYTSKKTTEDYMKEQKIQELMEYLFSKLLIAKPDNPKEYLVKLLQELKNKQAEMPLTDKNLETMYDLIDITNVGHITLSQLEKCLEQAKVKKEEIETIISKHKDEKIDKPKFVQIMKSAMDILKDTPWSLQ